MPEQLLEYKDFAKIRDELTEEYGPKFNLSSNAEFVITKRYLNKLGLEDRSPESIAQRMAALCLDVASADIKYMPQDMPYREKLEHVREKAKNNLEMYVDNRFRANTPANINFGRWERVYKKTKKGWVYDHVMKKQLGSACFVIPVDDTFGKSVDELGDGLLNAWIDQQEVHKGGGGTGFSFCRIRPKGSVIGYNPHLDGMNSMDWDGSAGVSSGYASFLDNFYDKATKAVMQGNTRRGANMGIQRIDHMDFLDHIYLKFTLDKKQRENLVRNFNLSFAAPDEVMEALEEGKYFTLYNPLRAKHKDVLKEIYNVEKPELVRKQDLATKEQFKELMRKNNISRHAPLPLPSMYIDDNGEDVINAYDGEKIGTILNDVVYIDGKRVREIISESNFLCAEPGFLFIDRVNEYNPTLFNNEMESTNPCGELPLMPYEACNLGSINAAKFARYSIFDNMDQAKTGLEEKILSDRFTKTEPRRDGKIGVVYYDWDDLDKTIEDAVHFLDNVIDRNDFPDKRITEAVNKTRKIGLGYMGIGDTMVLMKKRYGDDESLEFAEALAKRLHDKTREASQKLAEERGEFPLWKESIHNPDSELHKWFMSNPIEIIDKHRGSRKLANPNKVNRQRKMNYDLKLRNATTMTQAPTGTITRTIGVKDLGLNLDNLSVSFGIEPIYSLFQESPVLHTTLYDTSSAMIQLLKREGLFSDGLLDAIKENRGSVFEYADTPEEVKEQLRKIPGDVKNALVTASAGEEDRYEITPEQHVKMAAVFQGWDDNAVSKTINLPCTAAKGDIWNAYVHLWKLGSKGGTIYRDMSREEQILNRVAREFSGLKDSRKIRRPFIQEAFVFELPYPRTEINERPAEDVLDKDFDPDRCFTQVSYNRVNGSLTGIFQNFSNLDPNLISTVTHRNIAISRDLKNGKPLREIIEEVEKLRTGKGLIGVAIDEAVIPKNSNEKLRFQVEAGNLEDSFLKSLYATAFFTEDGENLNPESIQERLSMYYKGEITFRSIINTKGRLNIEEVMPGGRPSILKKKKIPILPIGMNMQAEKLCPECG